MHTGQVPTVCLVYLEQDPLPVGGRLQSSHLAHRKDDVFSLSHPLCAGQRENYIGGIPTKLGLSNIKTQWLIVPVRDQRRHYHSAKE